MELNVKIHYVQQGRLVYKIQFLFLKYISYSRYKCFIVLVYV